MLITILATLAATQTVGAATSPAPITSATTQPAKPAKPKRKRHQSCGNESPSLGSHIIMDSCPTDQDQEDATTKSMMDLRQGSYAEPGPH